MDSQTLKKYLALLSKPELTEAEQRALRDICASSAVSDTELAEQKRLVSEYVAMQARASKLDEAEQASGAAIQALAQFDEAQTNLAAERKAKRAELAASPMARPGHRGLRYNIWYSQVIDTN